MNECDAKKLYIFICKRFNEALCHFSNWLLFYGCLLMNSAKKIVNGFVVGKCEYAASVIDAWHGALAMCVCVFGKLLFVSTICMKPTNFLKNLFQCIVAQVKLISGRENRVDALARGNRPATMDRAMGRAPQRMLANRPIPCQYRTSNRRANRINNKTVRAA